MSRKLSVEDEDYGILKKALDVEIPDDFDPTKVPQNGQYTFQAECPIFTYFTVLGEEYIQLVMYEAQHCDEWIKADIDTSKFSKNQTFKVEVHIQTFILLSN